MGDKRISVRTLPDGSKAYHHPPDDAHPDGKLVLITESGADPAGDPEEFAARRAELKQAYQDAIDTKRASERAKGVPPEKSPF